MLFVGLSLATVVAAPLVQIVLGIVTGVVMARLFVLGHDACHGSLLPGPRSNRLVGRALFLPTLVPFSLWEVGHNVAHHGYTNLRGRDYVWAPLAKPEYDAMGGFRRLLEHWYRGHLSGLGAYYAIELWWKRLYFPSRTHVGARRRVHLLDGWLVTSFAALWWAALIALATAFDRAAIWTLAVGFALPFLTWNVLMGFVIYVQHTHPDIAWFNNRKQWEWFRSQVDSTPHVIFPLPFSAVLHHIMEHTAHHLDMRIPSYELSIAQADLESKYEEIRTYHWSFHQFHDVMRRCKLYDYERHCWTDFSGNVTARTQAAILLNQR